VLLNTSSGGSGGGGGGGGSQVRFVPIGLLVAGGAALMRRLRRSGV
jgi:hypothetical protein